jgi:DNA-binding transcriptional LysR family regulator
MRSVAPTEAGERLVLNVGPRFDEIDTELAALSELREKPAGTIRITAGEHAEGCQARSRVARGELRFTNSPCGLESASSELRDPQN